jgi:hypothetical protein
MDRAPRHLARVGTLAVLFAPVLASPDVLSAQAEALAVAAKDAITSERLDAHAFEITRHVRPSGSPGENAAIDYVVGRLRADGVPVEVHEFMAYTSNPVSARVEVLGTRFAPAAITMSFSGATEGVEAVAVDVGDLADLPTLEIGTGERLVVRDAAGFEAVRGRVAVVTGQPRNIPTTVLQQLGAIAVIYVNPEERLNELIVTSTWGTPSLLSAHRLNVLPTAQIRRSDGDRLRAMMADGEVRVRVSTEVETGWQPLRLAVARVMPPDDADAPYVLFGGHIDGWHHGATDEGASNAAMLELALAFHRNRSSLRRGLVVAWWPGHSNARYGGATWFADHFFDELRARGLAYVNVDGIGQMEAKRFGASTSPALRRLAMDVIRAGTGQAVTPSRPGRNSDQAFNGVGLPLLQISHSRLAEDGGYWWWHTPDDTYDKIDAEILEVDAELYADALSAMLAGARFPVDLETEARALIEALDAREVESGGALDLSEARSRARALGETFAAATRAWEEAPPSGELDLAVLRALRPIHRVMFAPGSAHHPDPGIYSAPLPGLEPAAILAEAPPGGDRYRFAQAQLVREANRIIEAIAEAEHHAVNLITTARRPGA